MEDLFPSSLTLLLTRNSSFSPGGPHQAGWQLASGMNDEKEKGKKREREKSTKTETSVFYNLIVKVTYCYLCHSILITQTLIQSRKGLHKGMNSRRQERLEAILDTSYHLQ